MCAQNAEKIKIEAKFNADFFSATLINRLLFIPYVKKQANSYNLRPKIITPDLVLRLLFNFMFRTGLRFAKLGEIHPSYFIASLC